MNLEINIDLYLNKLHSWSENHCDIKRSINRAANSGVRYRNEHHSKCTETPGIKVDKSCDKADFIPFLE